MSTGDFGHPVGWMQQLLLHLQRVYVCIWEIKPSVMQNLGLVFCRNFPLFIFLYCLIKEEKTQIYVISTSNRISVHIPVSSAFLGYGQFLVVLKVFFAASFFNQINNDMMWHEWVEDGRFYLTSGVFEGRKRRVELFMNMSASHADYKSCWLRSMSESELRD